MKLIELFSDKMLVESVPYALVYVKGKDVPYRVNENDYLNHTHFEKGVLRFFSEIVHRPSEEGPAICFRDGSETYFENGRRHRLDGPAAINYLTSTKAWYVNGQKHNETGPAVTYGNNHKEYWLNGEELSEETWRETLKRWQMR